MRQYLLGLKILGLACLIGAIAIGTLFILVGPIIMGFFQNPSATMMGFGKAFAIGIAICTFCAIAKYIAKAETGGK